MRSLADNIASEVESDGLVVGVVVEEFKFVVETGFEVGIDALVGPILYSRGTKTTGVSALFLDQLLNEKSK